jgi:hypothetical protein
MYYCSTSNKAMNIHIIHLVQNKSSNPTKSHPGMSCSRPPMRGPCSCHAPSHVPMPPCRVEPHASRRRVELRLMPAPSHTLACATLPPSLCPRLHRPMFAATASRVRFQVLAMSWVARMDLALFSLMIRKQRVI